ADRHSVQEKILNCIGNTATTVCRGEKRGGAIRWCAGGKRYPYHGWGGDAESVSDVVALAFVGSEEEGFVFDDGSAQTSTKLFQAAIHFRGRRLIKKIARVHRAVTAECKRSAVQSVGARLQSYVDDRS